MAVSCSSTPKGTRSWTSFLFVATFYNSRRPVPFLGLFLFEIALFPYFWKVFLCVLYLGTPWRGILRRWETRLRRNPGPCHCPHSAHTPHRWGSGSSDPPPPTLGHCWRTGLGLNFSECLEWGSKQNPRRPGKGSWMGRTSHCRCNPEGCWLHCCPR